MHNDRIHRQKHTQRKQKVEDEDEKHRGVASRRGVVDEPTRRPASRGFRVPGERTMSKRSCPSSRACNPARSHTSQYTGANARAQTRADRLHVTPTRAHTHTHTWTLCTLDLHTIYTRYGYVKPIDFVNCRLRNQKAADFRNNDE